MRFFRIRDCLAQLYAKDITPDDKQELDEALQREVKAYWILHLDMILKTNGKKTWVFVRFKLPSEQMKSKEHHLLLKMR